MDFGSLRRGVGMSIAIETMPPKKKTTNMLSMRKYKVTMVVREDIEVS